MPVIVSRAEWLPCCTRPLSQPAKDSRHRKWWRILRCWRCTGCQGRQWPRCSERGARHRGRRASVQERTVEPLTDWDLVETQAAMHMARRMVLNGGNSLVQDKDARERFDRTRSRVPRGLGSQCFVVKDGQVPRWKWHTRVHRIKLSVRIFEQVWSFFPALWDV